MANLYLFPDTNLFIQCKALSELEWAGWLDFEEIHLIVCRPVQREIDNQKNRGSDRIGKRARAASSLFGKIIRSDNGYVVVSSGEVVVKLFLEAAKLPDQSLKDRLDYSRFDDEIVGCLSRFRNENPGDDARLLSNDNGAMATAKALDLPYNPVPSDWLLAAEETDEEKEIKRLRREIDELKNRIPKFEVRCYGMDDSEIPVLSGGCRVYQPLTYDEVSLLMRDLESNYSQDQEWLTNCMETLLKLHEALQRAQGGPQIRFDISNSGSTPGQNALVEIVAESGFRLIPPLEDVPEWMQEENSAALRLPTVPAPPKFAPLGLANLIMPSSLRSPTLPDSLFESLRAPDRENDELDYRDGVPESPSGTLRLDCEQWRHGIGPKSISLCVWPDTVETPLTGRIRLTLHAANLTTLAEKTVGVNLSISKGDTLEFARGLVGNL